jgi:hypothetical protein
MLCKYHVAGNFRWYKISRNCTYKKFSWFNFRSFSTSRAHPCQLIACMTLHVFSAHLRLRGSYSRGTQPVREKCEIFQLYGLILHCLPPHNLPPPSLPSPTTTTSLVPGPAHLLEKLGKAIGMRPISHSKLSDLIGCLIFQNMRTAKIGPGDEASPMNTVL